MSDLPFSLACLNPLDHSNNLASNDTIFDWILYIQLDQIEAQIILLHYKGRRLVIQLEFFHR